MRVQVAFNAHPSRFQCASKSLGMRTQVALLACPEVVSIPNQVGLHVVNTEASPRRIQVAFNARPSRLNAHPMRTQVAWNAHSSRFPRLAR